MSAAVTTTAVAAADCRRGERVLVRFVPSSSPSTWTSTGRDDGERSTSGDEEDEEEDPTTPTMIVFPPMTSAHPHPERRRHRHRRRRQSPWSWSKAASGCCHTCGADLTDDISSATGYNTRHNHSPDGEGEASSDAVDGDCDGVVHLDDGCDGDRYDGKTREPIDGDDGSAILGCPLCTDEVPVGGDGDDEIRSGSSPLYCSEGCRPSSARLPSSRSAARSCTSTCDERFAQLVPSPHVFFCGASSGQMRAVGEYLRKITRRGDEDVGYTLLATCLAFLSLSSSSPSEGAETMTHVQSDGSDGHGDGGGEGDNRGGTGRGRSDDMEEARRRALLSDIVVGGGCAAATRASTRGYTSDATRRKGRRRDHRCSRESCDRGDDDDDADGTQHPTSPAAAEEGGRESDPRMSGAEMTAVEECWSLLSAALLGGLRRDDRDGRGRGSDRHRSESGRHPPAPPDLDSFVEAYVRVRRHFLLPHPIVVPTRLLVYLASGKMSDLPEERLSDLLEKEDAPLRPFVDHAFRKDGGYGGGDTTPFDDGEVGAAEEGEESGVGTAWKKTVMPNPSRSVLLRRMAARVAQVASDPTADDADDGGRDESPFEAARHRFRVLCPEYASSLRHSCVPNCAVEGYYDDDGDEDGDDEGDLEEAEDCSGSGANVATATAMATAAGNGSRRHGVREGRPRPRSGPRPSPLGLRLIALHDLTDGEVLTMSKIDHESLTSSAERRSAVLREKMLLPETFRCDCVRCRYERERPIPLPDVEALSRVELKRLGDLAMQHGRYADAVVAYGLILAKEDHCDADEDDGDVLHARAAALLHMGRHREAHEAWEEADRLCRGSHDGIALHVRKREAYGNIFCFSSPAALTAKSGADDGVTNGGTSKNGKRKRPPEAQEEEEEEEEEDDEEGGVANDGGSTIVRSLPPYLSLLGRKCFVTAPGHPLLSSEECVRAIRWAEEHAASSKNGGWTTSRHYAVPTTDVPVHEIPPLLSWFRSLLRRRLFPLLAEQFGSSEVGTNGSRIAVHDAFVVRYDAAAGQSHLPMHRDESTHSFTVALNERSEYDGGGTYVAELGRSVIPERGGVLSFRGDEVLHGGDPVVRGVRYILVAFCYVGDDDVSTVGRKGQFAPNKAADKFFSSQDKRREGSFAFGFEV